MALTNKQRIFITEYVADFNATRAAIAAGYSQNMAYSIGWENTKKPEIAAEIEKLVSARCMPKGEVLARLAEHARGDIGDFVTIGPDGLPGYDFSRELAQGKMRLIKRLKTKRKSYLEGQGDDQHLVTEVDVELELYDAQGALEKIGRHHKLFTDVSELTGRDGKDLQATVIILPSNGRDSGYAEKDRDTPPSGATN